MKEIIIIGTLHGKNVPHKELEDILVKLNPDKVLVELSPEELLRPREKSIRDEMFSAYDWAIQNNKQVDVFDIENNTLKPGLTGKEPGFAEYNNKLAELSKKYSWQELNKTEPWQDPEIIEAENSFNNQYIDMEKSKERDEIMLKNIMDKVIEGKNLIITGVGHLTFLKEKIPSAKLLLRD